MKLTANRFSGGSMGEVEAQGARGLAIHILSNFAGRYVHPDGHDKTPQQMINLMIDHTTAAIEAYAASERSARLKAEQERDEAKEEASDMADCTAELFASEAKLATAQQMLSQSMNANEEWKFEKPEEGEWVQPVEEGYLLKCCGCGLVHRVDFRVYEGRAQFRMFLCDEPPEVRASSGFGAK